MQTYSSGPLLLVVPGGLAGGFQWQQSCFNHDKEGQTAVVHLLRLQSKSLGVMPVAVKGLGGFSLGEITYLQSPSCFPL